MGPADYGDYGPSFFTNNVNYRIVHGRLYDNEDTNYAKSSIDEVMIWEKQLTDDDAVLLSKDN